VVGYPRMSVPSPQVSEPKNSNHSGATQKVVGDHLPTSYCYTTLPLHVVATPPSSSYCRLQQVVAPAQVDGVGALIAGLAGVLSLAASQVPVVAAMGGELVDLAEASRRGHVLVLAAVVPCHLLLHHRFRCRLFRLLLRSRHRTSRLVSHLLRSSRLLPGS
jgi:hypothetical protein